MRVIPNFVTSLNLLCGFMSCLFSFEGKFTIAFYFILLGAIFDMVDGRLARLKGAGSKFGVEFDSLSDLITFGIAPSFLLYNMHFYAIAKWGRIFAFLPLVSVAIRLARFNVNFTPTEKRYFQGLSSPIGCILLASSSLVLQNFDIMAVYAIAIFSIFLSILMVSTIKFRSFKDFRIQRRNAPLAILIISTLFAIFLINPPLFLLVLFSGYIIFNFVENIVGITKNKRRRKQKIKYERESLRVRHDIEGRGTIPRVLDDSGGKN